MLKLLDATPAEQDERFLNILNHIKSCDRFIVITERNQLLQLNYYKMTDAEMIFALEWAKMRLLLEERNF